MFKNAYKNQTKKEEFFITYKDNKKVTDESQIAQSSIVEMAKKYGIEAIIQKAEETTLNANNIKDKLYGFDLTQGFKSKEELLNIKKKVSNVFQNIPARIRKDVFKDDVINFVNAYTSNDETALKELNKLGIVSDTQFERVKNYNKQIQAEKAEIETKNRFIKELEKVEGNLYENYKNTGNISINNNTNTAKDI